MALRIHFTARDLARVVVGRPRQPPVSEAVMSLQVMARRDQAVRFDVWRQDVRARMPERHPALGALIPTQGWMPDFLTPGARYSSKAAAFDAIRATPVQQLTADLARLSTNHRLPRWAHRLAQGDADLLRAVADGIAEYYELAITPYARGILAALDADHARRAHVLSSRGVDSVLKELHPAVCWNPPVLEMPATGEVDFHLQGRGLLISVHYFCGARPRALLNNVDTPVLVCPPSPDIVHRPLLDASSTQAGSQPALAAVLGRTRAAVLQVIALAPGSSTAQLAHRLDISLASASEHATTLREAGVVHSHRHGNTVRHDATALGIELLNAGRS